MRNIIGIIVLLAMFSCNSTGDKQENKPLTIQEKAEGKLFIIGGGGRPDAMVDSLIRISGIGEKGYMIVLPMSSGVPDTSAYYSSLQFKEMGIDDIHTFNIQDAESVSDSRLDSLRGATLIYITGGDQRQFMEIVRNTKVHQAIREAFMDGATVAGTSAGAAMMSRKMITGDEIKHSEYTGDFRTIEADNMIIKPGLGLLEKVIIDQHFIQRMRMNRLLTVVLENPGFTGIGIDESTAILVEKNMARVIGESQVIVVRNSNEEVHRENGLLKAENLELSIYTESDSFFLESPLSGKN